MTPTRLTLHLSCLCCSHVATHAITAARRRPSLTPTPRRAVSFGGVGEVAGCHAVAQARPCCYSGTCARTGFTISGHKGSSTGPCGLHSAANCNGRPRLRGHAFLCLSARRRGSGRQQCGPHLSCYFCVAHMIKNCSGRFGWFRNFRPRYD